MSQTWIIFTIDDRQVYQIEYRGCTGQDTIDGYKSMIAGEYKVSDRDVKVSFTDDLIKNQKTRLKTKEKIISSKLIRDTLEMLVQKETYN